MRIHLWWSRFHGDFKPWIWRFWHTTWTMAAGSNSLEVLFRFFVTRRSRSREKTSRGGEQLEVNADENNQFVLNILCLFVLFHFPFLFLCLYQWFEVIIGLTTGREGPETVANNNNKVFNINFHFHSQWSWHHCPLVGLARAWFTLVTVPVEGLVNY